MLEPSDGARDVFMDTVITKIDQQDEKSQLQEKRIAVLESRQAETAKLASNINGIRWKTHSN